MTSCEAASAPVSFEALVTAHCLALDRMACEVIDALEARGVESILMKGATFASWLYRDGTLRGYGDADLLVAPQNWSRSQDVLLELGFKDALETLRHPRMASWASYPWARGGETLDLHSTFFGIGAEPAVVWEVLGGHSEWQRVAGRDVRVLDATARAMQVALHAGQHGPTAVKALEDLERAIEMLSDPEWAEVAALAERLDATGAFAAGLRLVPSGVALADRLGLIRNGSLTSSLRRSPAPLVEGLEDLSATRGMQNKLSLARAELFPSTAFMRWWSPLARRGRLGLLLARCWRPVWLLVHLPLALATWRRLKRRDRRAAAFDLVSGPPGSDGRRA
jgi:hypothetical protein